MEIFTPDAADGSSKFVRGLSNVIMFGIVPVGGIAGVLYLVGGLPG